MPDFPSRLASLGGHGDRPMLRLFGEPCVTHRLRRIDVPRSCQRLVVFVAIRRCQVGRSVAASTLWPIKDDARAGGNLRSVLWRLNRMDVQLLDFDKHAILMRDDVLVDSDTVALWADRVLHGTASPAELRAVPRNLEALELVPGWFDDWVMFERERLRQRLLHALEAQSRGLTAMDLHADAVEAAMVAVGAEPLRESAQRALAVAHLAAGNRVEARRAVSVYAELLGRELGVRPSPELQALA